MCIKSSSITITSLVKRLKINSKEHLGVGRKL